MSLFKGKKGHGRNFHIVLGLAVVGILYYLNLQNKWIDIPMDNILLIQLGIIAFIYSQGPDIDQPGSIINRWLTTAILGFIVFAFYNPAYQQYAIVGVVLLALLKWIGHRTVIHSALGGAILSAPLYYISPLHALVAFIAFLTHIISEGEFSIWSGRDWW